MGSVAAAAASGIGSCMLSPPDWLLLSRFIRIGVRGTSVESSAIVGGNGQVSVSKLSGVGVGS